MALFNRKKNQNQSVLPELDKYYEGERKERTGLAWLLAIVSVVIVAAFIILLFLAGRWVYQEISSDGSDTEQISVTDEAGDSDLPSFDGNSDNEENSEQAESTEDKNREDVLEESNQSEQSGDSEGRVDAPARTEIPSDPNEGSQPIPTTGDDGLPNTGPADTIAIFIIVTILATGLYRFTASAKN